MQDLAFHAFPSLQQLQEATDEGLRAEGFGYRWSASNTHMCQYGSTRRPMRLMALVKM